MGLIRSKWSLLILCPSLSGSINSPLNLRPQIEPLVSLSTMVQLGKAIVMHDLRLAVKLGSHLAEWLLMFLACSLF